MATGIMAYQVDLNILENYYGTKELASIQKLIELYQSELESLDEDFEVEDGWKSAEDILRNFLLGTLESIENETAKHWYILELLIGECGKILDNGACFSMLRDPFFGYDEFEIFSLSKTEKFKIEWPDDFPLAFTIENKNLQLALDRVKEDYEQEQVDEFERWVKGAQADKEDLVLFIY